jgi:hypothetical protein
MVIGFSVETKENTSTQVPKTTFIDAQNRLHTPTDQTRTQTIHLTAFFSQLAHKTPGMLTPETA